MLDRLGASMFQRYGREADLEQGEVLSVVVAQNTFKYYFKKVYQFLKDNRFWDKATNLVLLTRSRTHYFRGFFNQIYNLTFKNNFSLELS